MRRKEGEYIRSLKPSLNKVIAGRTKREHHEDNRENHLAATQTYYQEKKEHLAPKKKNGAKIIEKELT